MLDSLTNVLNSNEDVAFDSSCWIDIGTFKYLRGGRGAKMSTLAKITNKRLIVMIRNCDKRCLVRATLVALASACRIHLDEFWKIQALHSTHTNGEILVHFVACPIWYCNDLRHNHKGTQNTLTKQVCQILGIVTTKPLMYAFIPCLEDLLNVNIYVVSVC